MDIIKALLKELDGEFATTKKFLALVPSDKMDWAPHEKSMKMGPLAVHIAELPSWICMALNADELDFATMEYTPQEPQSGAEIVQILENSYKAGRADLEKADLSKFNNRWILRTGETIHAEMTKYEMIRVAYSQTTHHRAQLGVYLRLLNIAIPGSYGPSADENSFGD